MSTVLVTGGSGFVGSHALLKLLTHGHQVRTTVRSLQREGEVRALLKAAGGARVAGKLSAFWRGNHARIKKRLFLQRKVCCNWVKRDVDETI